MLSVFLIGCESEKCTIDFESNSSIYIDAVKKINELKLNMDSQDVYFRPILSINSSDSILDSNVFVEIDYVEIHEDATIIFQAPNCSEENNFRDAVYFLAFSPKGIVHVKRKRNIEDCVEIEKDWFSCKHIRSLAN